MVFFLMSVSELTFICVENECMLKEKETERERECGHKDMNTQLHCHVPISQTPVYADDAVNY